MRTRRHNKFQHYHYLYTFLSLYVPNIIPRPQKVLWICDFLLFNVQDRCDGFFTNKSSHITLDYISTQPLYLLFWEQFFRLLKKISDVCGRSWWFVFQQNLCLKAPHLIVLEECQGHGHFSPVVYKGALLYGCHCLCGYHNYLTNDQQPQILEFLLA